MMVLRALQRTAPVRALREIARDPPAADEVRDERRIDGSVRRHASETREARRPADAEPFRWDAARSSRLALWAVAFHAPYLHWLHPWYERIWLKVPNPVDGRQGRARPDFHGPPFLFCFLTYSALAEGKTPATGPGAISLWTDSGAVLVPRAFVTFNLPVPVRVLWQRDGRIYFGSLMSLRANAPLADEVRDGIGLMVLQV